MLFANKFKKIFFEVMSFEEGQFDTLSSAISSSGTKGYPGNNDTITRHRSLPVMSILKDSAEDEPTSQVS